MSIEHRAEQLEREFGYHPEIALVTARDNGTCCYCAEDLLASRPGYSSIARDRLIPDYVGDANNDVLACASCKEMKAEFNPLRGDESADDMLCRDKDRLILRVRTHLQRKIIARASEWHRAKDIIRGGTPRSRGAQAFAEAVPELADMVEG